MAFATDDSDNKSSDQRTQQLGIGPNDTITTIVDPATGKRLIKITNTASSSITTPITTTTVDPTTFYQNLRTAEQLGVQDRINQDLERFKIRRALALTTSRINALTKLNELISNQTKDSSFNTGYFERRSNISSMYIQQHLGREAANRHDIIPGLGTDQFGSNVDISLINPNLIDSNLSDIDNMISDISTTSRGVETAVDKSGIITKSYKTRLSLLRTRAKEQLNKLKEVTKESVTSGKDKTGTGTSQTGSKQTRTGSAKSKEKRTSGKSKSRETDLDTIDQIGEDLKLILKDKELKIHLKVIYQILNKLVIQIGHLINQRSNLNYQKVHVQKEGRAFLVK